jgi:hypothetical protein
MEKEEMMKKEVVDISKPAAVVVGACLKPALAGVRSYLHARQRFWKFALAGVRLCLHAVAYIAFFVLLPLAFPNVSPILLFLRLYFSFL